MMRYYFGFGQPRLYHRMVWMSLTQVRSKCGVIRNNTESLRWSTDPKGKVCKECWELSAA